MKNNQNTAAYGAAQQRAQIKRMGDAAVRAGKYHSGLSTEGEVVKYVRWTGKGGLREKITQMDEKAKATPGGWTGPKKAAAKK